MDDFEYNMVNMKITHSHNKNTFAAVAKIRQQTQETMPIDESLADIPEWRKPLREWWSRTFPHLSINSGHEMSRGIPVGFGCQVDYRWLCGGVLKSH